jgi:dihydropteroate synthase
MGVLNVTPDSFSDGGLHRSVRAAIDRVASMLDEGVYVVDVGGESTRPGAEPVPVDQELERVVPVIEAICARFDVAVSVDTSAPEVMQNAVASGACLINDVRAFLRDGAVQAAVLSGAGVCIMHMQGEPDTMQRCPRYVDVVPEVTAWLSDRAAALISAGVGPSAVLVDPGFGFGKSLEHNYRLLAGLRSLAAGAYPVVAGLSRKSMIGAATGKPVGQRLAGSIAGALLAVQNGARLVRVHDVGATVDALAVYRMAQQYPDLGIKE